MPSLRNSLIELDAEQYRRIDPRRVPVATPEPPFRPALPPEFPGGIRRSPVMISSLPIISTSVDNVIRQFYGGPNFPSRRLTNPG